MDRALSMENPNYQKQKINGKLVTFFLVLFAVIAISAIFILVNGGSRPVWELLDPKGIIATQQKRLIIICVSILLFAVIPTFVAMFYIVWKYRADKPNSSYSPEMRSSWLAAFTLWSIPSIFIIIIGVINWKSAHALDPYKPIASDKKPLTIQVVALQWKWLFIYPGQNIATVNFLEFPKDTPLNFKLTAEAPMTSFWIPQLGGQMFAMEGMQTQLHLVANQKGEFAGSTTEINGNGYAGMRFTAKSVTDEEFQAWVKSVQVTNNPLTSEKYKDLAKPTENNPIASYSFVQNELFNSVMMKFMDPSSDSKNSIEHKEIIK